jgi:hypothetical protein
VSPEQVGHNLATVETAINALDGLPLNQAQVAALRLQAHATLTLGSALVLVAEEIHTLRVALTEQ